MSIKQKAPPITRNILHTLVGVCTTTISFLLRAKGLWMNNNPAHKIWVFKRVGTENGPWRLFQQFAAGLSGIALVIDTGLLLKGLYEYLSAKTQQDKAVKGSLLKLQAVRTLVSTMFFAGALIIAIGTGGSGVLLAATLLLGTSKLIDVAVNRAAEKKQDKRELLRLMEKKSSAAQKKGEDLSIDEYNTLRQLVKRCPTPSTDELIKVSGIQIPPFISFDRKKVFKSWCLNNSDPRSPLIHAPGLLSTERLRNGRNACMTIAAGCVLGALLFPPLLSAVGFFFAAGLVFGLADIFKPGSSKNLTQFSTIQEYSQEDENYVVNNSDNIMNESLLSRRNTPKQNTPIRHREQTSNRGKDFFGINPNTTQEENFPQTTHSLSG